MRSIDPRMIELIGQLVKRLDVPTPLVLLEVKVLRILLSDGVESAFDFAFRFGEGSGAFTTGEIAAPAVGSVLPGGGGFNVRAGVFQLVSNNVQARLQLLQSKGQVTALATPLLLTAHGEVSRLFTGVQVPVVVGFSEPQVITGGVVQTTLPATPITELRDVGTDLLLTANINADRTVTISLLQESSLVEQDGGTILVPTGFGIQSATIDTVRTQAASGTIVAADGQMVIFGGLIEETVSEQREQLPIVGDIPLLGLLFRRENTLRSRSELIVLIRPYILNTPVEADTISRELLEKLSIHPTSTQPTGDLGVYNETDALKADEGYHTVSVGRYKQPKQKSPTTAPAKPQTSKTHP